MIDRRPVITVVAGLAISTIALVSRGGAQQEGFRSPSWPHLVTSTPPPAWRVEGEGRRTSWRAVARLVTVEDATLSGVETAARVAKGVPGADDGAPAAPRTLLRFEAGGASLDAAVPALPKEGALARAIAAGQEVEVTLVHAQGFEGVARGLIVREARAGGGGRLLLAFDDGGYGPALGAAGDVDGTTLSSVAIERLAGGGWQPVPVTFRRGDDSVTVNEGATVALGRSGLAATLVVSRAWGGPPPAECASGAGAGESGAEAVGVAAGAFGMGGTCCSRIRCW